MGITPDCTMSTVLYGDLVEHPWRDPHVDESDPYSLFVSRSSALGWLDELGAGAVGGLWGMNDAGRGAGPAGEDSDEPSAGGGGAADAGPSRIAWFQVAVAWPFPPGRPLPIQPFLACVGDVVTRIGQARVDAVQLLLPLEVLRACRGAPPGSGFGPRDGLRSLLQDAQWFVDLPAHAPVVVSATVDAGDATDVRPIAPGMRRWMREIRQDVFVCESVADADGEPTLGTRDDGWPGPSASAHRVAFRGTLAEWSLDAVGWLAAYLAEAAYYHGLDAPVTLTVRRVD